MEALINLGIFAVLLSVGFFLGRGREKKHYESILKREKSLLHIPARVDVPKNMQGEVFLVASSVVIANDYFKNFVANLKSFFGGRLTSYESLMDRARREVILRVKEQAIAKGATELVHLRIEMTALDQLGVEIMATASALRK